MSITLHAYLCLYWTIHLFWPAQNFNKHASLLTYTENIVNIRDTQIRQWQLSVNR